MSSYGGVFGKVKDFIQGHPEKSQQGLDKLRGVIDEKTGGRYSEQIERARNTVGGTLGIPGEQTEPAPGQPVPVPGEPAPGQPVPVPGEPTPGQPDPGQPTRPAPGEPAPARAPGQPAPPAPGPFPNPVPGPPPTPAPLGPPPTPTPGPSVGSTSA